MPHLIEAHLHPTQYDQFWPPRPTGTAELPSLRRLFIHIDYPSPDIYLFLRHITMSSLTNLTLNLECNAFIRRDDLQVIPPFPNLTSLAVIGGSKEPDERYSWVIGLEFLLSVMPGLRSLRLESIKRWESAVDSLTCSPTPCPNLSILAIYSSDILVSHLERLLESRGESSDYPIGHIVVRDCPSLQPEATASTLLRNSTTIGSHNPLSLPSNTNLVTDIS